ncbi:conserved oligomeric golgi complex subunit 1-like [Raphidocelis subcapitata]|uniref:Conserved oligomeric Golgi complex subunit 1 n=1 Tax=Raphidocelis subcapitata TaxID=307507 RepID=A0A2V0NLF6_9CHLO|nr:conserved oligomeric golgi complex subunit 1-like [Raphidocelis subcapitata]|eukprot:GBF88246.1 conserved oligomeric golgi complex subunit 1-like [Raphidocelis subcapitata]
MLGPGLGRQGGGLHKAPGSQAQRQAETLFETRNVVEIREIEARTRQDIADKSLQLRQRVGDSHRDLIEGTDKMGEIARKARAVAANVLAVQEALAALAVGVGAAPGGGGGGGGDGGGDGSAAVVRKHSDLHAIAGRVKYILDTTEVVWGSLDASQHTDAAKRFLRAGIVREQLRGSFPRELLARFPLLGHQWPQVQKFRGQIAEAARATLEGGRALSSAAAADALAALALLEGLPAAEALARLLSARHEWLQGRLAAAGAAGGGAGAAAAALAEAAQAVQATVAQVGALFLPPPPPTPAAARGAGAPALTLLQRSVDEAASDASELFFSGAFGLGDGAASPEAAAWSRAVAGALSALAPPTREEAARAVGVWLEEVAGSFSSAGLQLLGSCSDAAELREAERTVRDAAAAWRPEAAAPSGDDAAAAAAAGAGGAAAPAAPAPRGRVSGAAAAAAAGAGADAWDAVARAVLGRQLCVWEALLRDPFMARSKQLVLSLLQRAADSVAAPLDDALASAAAADPVPASAVRLLSWPGARGAAAPQGLALALARVHSGGGGLGSFGSGQLPADALEAAGFRDSIFPIRERFDELLFEALRATLQLMRPPDGGAAAGAAAAGPPATRARVSGAAAAPAADAERAAALTPHLQEGCLAAALALAASLEARLRALPAPAQGAAGAPAVEQALLIGRLCSELAARSAALPAALGPPASWAAEAAAAAAAGAAGPSSSAAAAPPPPRPAAAGEALSRVAARLRGIAVDAYRSWAAWAARCIASELSESYRTDSALSATAPPLSWAETVVSLGGGGGGDGGLFGLLSPGGGGGGGPGGEDEAVRFWLPAGTSPDMLSALMAACWETTRAGDHTAPTEALQLLAWELEAELSAAVARVAGEEQQQAEAEAGGAEAQPSQQQQQQQQQRAGAGAVTEKGILQLLFDLRFARDVLAGAHPADGGGGGGGAEDAAASAAAATAVAQRRRQLSDLQRRLEERLDPIDWATYEPHLWPNTAAAYRRSSVLLGALASLKRAHPDAPAKGSAAGAAAEANVFCVLPVAPRLQYLPVATPSVTQHLAAAARARGGGGGGAGGALAPGAAAAAAAGIVEPLGRAASLSGAAAAALERLGSGGAGGVAAAAAAAASAAAAVKVASDPAAEYSLSDFGSSSLYNSRAATPSGGLPPMPSSAAPGAAAAEAAMAGLSAGANAALGALQARLHGGVLGSAFTGMLGEGGGAAAAAARDVAQSFQNIGDLLPGGLMSSFGKSGSTGTRRG